MIPSLFPELEAEEPKAEKLVGIARMAAESEVVEAKRRVEYRDLETRRLLSRCNSDRVPFQWTINPYRGCEFACKYCFARYTHEFMELRNPSDFETQIFVKEFDAASFAKELDQVGLDEGIGIGTATDPYQPAERRYRTTRCILEILAKRKGHRLHLTTKSDLISQDAKLLAQVAKNHSLTVCITVTTLDPELARMLEPLAPRPDLRLAALHKLAKAGVNVGVLGSPILPLINDSEEQLDALAERAAKAGAAFYSAGVLFLQPCSKRVFFPFLQAQFPEIYERYRKRYAKSAFVQGRYPEIIQARLDAVRAKHGLKRGRDQKTMEQSGMQLTLF